ncbi:MAG TPA: Hsp20/alpha crystallin family protein [Kiritimatiellia bacterium]|nr:Hsp20/alpha crystallin family protein [Kiritimatiellia bacterium]HRZ11812.1 Hsp20/alpha crystallin family protein [Kiritimatiellia bacterium]HSA17382.1 Hsp20/alpha crystallin family protein [Kiritimatiellia bacterium]
MKNLIPWRRKEPTALPRETANPFERLHREMNELFDGFLRDFGGTALPSLWRERAEDRVLPSVEVAETDESVQVTVELPGMDEKDIQVSLDDNALMVKGEKKQEREERKKNYRLSERSYGQFQRVIPLPAGIETDQVKAQFKNGVLNIILPKARSTAAESRRIPVRSE